jgi:hypothetical protein
MSKFTFSIEHIAQTTGIGAYGFASGWVVIRHEDREKNLIVTRPYLVEGEAQKKADELSAQMASHA